MTLWTGQIVAAVVFTIVIAVGVGLGIRSRDRRLVTWLLVAWALQMTISVSIIVLTA